MQRLTSVTVARVETVDHARIWSADICVHVLVVILELSVKQVDI